MLYWPYLQDFTFLFLHQVINFLNSSWLNILVKILFHLENYPHIWKYFLSKTKQPNAGPLEHRRKICFFKIKGQNVKLILHMATNDLDFSLYFVFKNLLFFFFLNQSLKSLKTYWHLFFTSLKTLGRCV